MELYTWLLSESGESAIPAVVSADERATQRLEVVFCPAGQPPECVPVHWRHVASTIADSPATAVSVLRVGVGRIHLDASALFYQHCQEGRNVNFVGCHHYLAVLNFDGDVIGELLKLGG